MTVLKVERLNHPLRTGGRCLPPLKIQGIAMQNTVTAPMDASHHFLYTFMENISIQLTILKVGYFVQVRK
jgi:hypothetical protein